MAENESPKRSVRLGDDLDSLVDAHCEQHGRTFSQLVRMLLAKFFKVSEPEMREGRPKRTE